MECRFEGIEDSKQEGPQPLEDQAEVVAGGGEDGVGLIAVSAFEEVAAEMAVGLEVADDGLDGRAAAELTLDGAVDAALLAGEVDP